MIENTRIPIAVLFTSPSTVEAFPKFELKNKKICAIGRPTEKALLEIIPEQDIIKGAEASIADMVFALAADIVNNVVVNILKRDA